ncbi:MAG: tetraacyldisaccharide 4'-kinase [Desulfobacterales bacterium]|nr:MAG: tetraacyldisaccharide 4'-kinase [Desulfobacterales bacterium]
MLQERPRRLDVLAALLQLVSFGYGGLQHLRAALYRRRILASHKLPCKVISIGNITVGGTGKTPMTIDIAQRLKRLGYKVAVISRGYKGRLEKKGGIVSDGQRILEGPVAAGDEPYMMAAQLRNIPVVVGAHRLAAGRRALHEFQPDVVVLDDAFQHLQLARDVDLVLLDHARPFGNGYLLPRGILREPIGALARGDAFILTRAPRDHRGPETAWRRRLQALAPPRPVFAASHIPYFCQITAGQAVHLDALPEFSGAEACGRLKGRKVLAFSGIARNDDFQETVDELDCSVTRFLRFPDHHRYSAGDWASILDCARSTGADLLITTAKDHARAAPGVRVPLDLMVIGVRISFGAEEQAVETFIQNRLAV